LLQAALSSVLASEARQSRATPTTLLCRSDRDALEVLDAGPVEMAHQDAARPELSGELCTPVGRVA